MESNLNLRGVLNGLIQTCKDGEEGFSTAAENINSEEIKQIFTAYSLERAGFVRKLRTASHEIGDSDPEDTGSVPGTIHRGWIELKGAVLNKDPQAILIECERGESSAVADYVRALKLEFPPDMLEMLSHQYAAILTAHKRIRSMSDAGARWV